MKDGSAIHFKYRQALANFRSGLANVGMIEKLDWSDIHVVIFVSTGRTGTHFMSHFFNNNYKETLAVHEPDINIYDLNINYLKGAVSDAQAHKIFDLFRKDMHKEIRDAGARNYVESNLELTFLIPILRKHLGSLKIIHVVRDGKDVVRSYYSRMARGKWVGEVPIFSDKDPRDRLNATIFPDDPYHDQWKDMDRFDRICWYWSKYNQLIEDLTKNDPNSMQVKFEDLFKKKNVDVWNKMITFSGLDQYQKANFDIPEYIDSSRSNVVKTFKIGKYPEWNDDLKETFKKHCADTMTHYGYEI